MKTLEILENKFNPRRPPAPEASPAPSATPPAVQVTSPAWRSCASVVALSEYLKARDWIHLVSYADGAYGLRFAGGISPAAAERWAAAREALALLADADEDLRRLIRSGDLKLPCTDQVPVSHHWIDDDGHPRGFFLSTGPSHPSKDRGTRTAR